MAIHVRYPILLSAAQPNAWTFSALFFIESVARAALVTVLPLTAYALFGDKGSVSLVYTGVSVMALSLSFAIPVLVRRLSRRWTYTLGCALVGACAALLALQTPPLLVLAMLARTLGAAMLNVTLSLYIMDNIGKRELTRSEPLRMGVATLAWGIAPYAGVWLMQHGGVPAASALSLGAVVLLAAVFWALRLAEGGPIRAGRSSPPVAPWRAVPRFVAQPRLRLAWLIAFGRSAFWVTFFIYIPILLVEGGLGPTAAGLAVAAGNLTLFHNFASRRYATAFSLRRVLGAAYLAAAGWVALTAALSAASPALAAVAMVAAAFFVALIDGLGPVAFLRAVHIHERVPMATVYRTYLDASELLPPLVYYFLLEGFGFAGAFGGLALAMAAIGVTVLRHLPRRM